MVARRWITPLGDYELRYGRPRGDDTMTSAVVLRLRMRRGSCPLLPHFGSRLYTIDKLTSTSGRLAESFAHEALGDLVQRGVIRDLVVKGTVHDDHLTLLVAFRDEGGARRPVEFTWRVGSL